MFLFVIFLALTGTIVDGLARNVKEGFDVINTRLEAEVSDPGAEANFNKAADWLSTLKIEDDYYLYRSLESFLKLREVEGKCGPESTPIISENHASCRYLSLSIEPKRRIDIVVHDFALKHVRECLPHWEKLFLEKTSKIPKSLGIILDALRKGRNLDDDGTLYSDCIHPPGILMTRPVRSFRDAEVIYKHLVDIAKNDVNYHALFEADQSGGKSVDFRSLTQMLYKYFEDPCINYHSSIKELYEFLPGEIRALNRENFKKESEKYSLFTGLARARLCEYIILSYVTKDIKKDELKHNFIKVVKSHITGKN